MRETFHSSLRLARWCCRTSASARRRPRRAVALFREHDERSLLESHAFYDDERQLIQNAAAGRGGACRPVRGRPAERPPDGCTEPAQVSPR